MFTVMWVWNLVMIASSTLQKFNFSLDKLDCDNRSFWKTSLISWLIDFNILLLIDFNIQVFLVFDTFGI